MQNSKKNEESRKQVIIKIILQGPNSKRCRKFSNFPDKKFKRLFLGTLGLQENTDIQFNKIWKSSEQDEKCNRDRNHK